VRVGQDLFNEATQSWDIDYYFTFVRDDNNLVIEETTYFNGSAGTKNVYRYGSDKQIVHSEVFTCADQKSCLQGTYEPWLVADYTAGDTVDYATSQIFVSGVWENYDSLANVYDREGSLTTMFYQELRLHGNNTTLTHERHIFSYAKENAVTGTTEEIPGELMLYPNPVGEVLNIKTHLPDYTIDVYDTQGRVAGHCVNCPTLNFSEHPPGIYILSIESQRKRYRRKVIKYVP
jgi:hypothetical protein